VEDSVIISLKTIFKSSQRTPEPSSLFVQLPHLLEAPAGAT